MRAFLIGAYTFVMLAGAMFLGGKVEGNFFPVVEGVQFVRVDPVGETRSRIWGGFRKVRDCDFDSVEFRLGAPGRSIIADLDFEEGAKVRTPGLENFGPWLVQLTDDQLAKRSYSVAFHRCYFLYLGFYIRDGEWGWRNPWREHEDDEEFEQDESVIKIRIPRPWLTETRFHPQPD